MKLDVTFSESTTEIPAQFSGLHIVSNGLPPDEVDKRVADARAEGFEMGRQAAYDWFWDTYQENGNRKDYDRAFAGIGWHEETFRPKYLIRPTIGDGYMLFAASNIPEITEQTADLSQLTRLDYTFYNTHGIKRVEIRVPRLTRLDSTFLNNYSLETLCMFELPETCLINGGFQYCTNLKHLRITGVIGGQMLNLSWSPLTTDSMKSVILCLKNHSGTEKAYTCTVQFSPACWAALEEEGDTAPGGISWRRYVTEILCWNT